jgi:hypothetical protein
MCEFVGATDYGMQRRVFLEHHCVERASDRVSSLKVKLKETRAGILKRNKPLMERIRNVDVRHKWQQHHERINYRRSTTYGDIPS